MAGEYQQNVLTLEAIASWQFVKIVGGDGSGAIRRQAVKLRILISLYLSPCTRNLIILQTTQQRWSGKCGA